MSRFTRHHYETIANALVEARPIIGDYDMSAMPEVLMLWKTTVYEICEALAAGNENFDRDVFEAWVCK